MYNSHLLPIILCRISRVLKLSVIDNKRLGPRNKLGSNVQFATTIKCSKWANILPYFIIAPMQSKTCSHIVIIYTQHHQFQLKPSCRLYVEICGSHTHTHTRTRGMTVARIRRKIIWVRRITQYTSKAYRPVGAASSFSFMIKCIDSLVFVTRANSCACFHCPTHTRGQTQQTLACVHPEPIVLYTHY